MKRSDLYVSMSPHVHAGYSVPKMMYETIFALIPIIFAGWFYFGMAALKIVALCGVTAVVTEAAWQKLIGRPMEVILDGSALLSGILLGLLLPSEIPWWMVVLGAIVTIVVGKQLYGGLGQNPFNAVIVGWAFTYISYSTAMNTFAMPAPAFYLEPNEMMEYPPLEVLKQDGPEAFVEMPWKELLLGNVPGSIGTTSVLAALLGGAYLLFRRIVTWHVPVSFILSTWFFALIFWIRDPEVYVNPTFQIFTGWVMLAAFFIAPEKGSSPVTARGKIMFGISCGVLTMIIRIWGTYIDGVAFAILLSNTLAPLMDRIRPRAIGRVREIA